MDKSNILSASAKADDKDAGEDGDSFSAATTPPSAAAGSTHRAAAASKEVEAQQQKISLLES